MPLGFRSKETHTLGSQHKKFSKTKSEESGYDSDTTRYFGNNTQPNTYSNLCRKSGSSPRGSVKSDSFDPSETESSTSERTSVEGESGRRVEEEEEEEEEEGVRRREEDEGILPLSSSKEQGAQFSTATIKPKVGEKWSD